MCKIITVALMVFAVSLMAESGFAQNRCNFHYQFSGKDWSVLCNALNDPHQSGAFVISDVTYFADKVIGGNDMCDRDEFITYPDAQTKTRRNDPKVRGLSTSWIDGKCKILPGDTGSGTPPGLSKIQQRLQGIGQGFTRGQDHKNVSNIVIFMDYYDGSKGDFNIKDRNGSPMCVQADQVRPVILKLSRTKKGGHGSAWNNWEITTYAYLPDTTDLPGVPACFTDLAHHGGLPGWTNYTIKPNQANKGANRLLEVTYSYEDGSGTKMSATWQQYCRNDALYVQSARAHILHEDGKDICWCNANSGKCQ